MLGVHADCFQMKLDPGTTPFGSSTLGQLRYAVEIVNPKFHRYAVLVVISSLIPIAIGAYITSQASGRQPASRGVLDAVVHKDVAIAVGILALGLTWQLLERERRLLGWAALGFIALEGWVGWSGAPLVHASLAPLVFAIFVAIAVVTSSSWNEAPELVEDQAASTLRLFAIVMPALMLLQIMLGAAYRHKLTGLLPHLGGAMIVSLATLVLGMLVVRRHPEHRKLRAAATWLISIFLVQVTLGMAAFIMPLLKLPSPVPVIAVTASHVVVGSLTLAASLVLAMQVQRNVRQPERREKGADSSG
jgi:heme A synthase